MSLYVRKAVKSDIGKIVALMDYLLGIEEDFPNMKENQIRGFGMIIESDTADIFVAELKGEIVGMCGFQQFISTVQGGYVGVVEDVVVSPQHSGKGIASQMLGYLEEYAKEAGLSRLHLMVDKGNAPAISLYKKLGWSQTKYIGFRKYI